jgi:hypothetical protein
MAIEFLQQINLNETPVKQLVPEKVTTTQRDAISSPASGRTIYNTSTNKLQVYNGTTWLNAGGDYSLSRSEATVSGSTAANLTLTGPTTSDTDSIIIAATSASGLGVSTLVSDQINIYHQDTSSVSNLTASSRTYVTGMTFDSFGHVTDVSTATETVTQTRLREDSGTYRSGDLTLQSGTDISITEPSTGVFDISFTGSDTTYNFSLAAVSGNSTVLTLDASAGDDDTVTFSGTTNEIEITTPSTGDAGTVKIGLPSDVTIDNDLTVENDLTVNGDATITGSLTITGDLISTQSERIDLEDSVIQLNSNASGAPADTADAGLEVNRGTATNTKLLWDEGTDRWTFTNNGTNYYNIPLPSEYDDFGGWDLQVNGSDVQQVDATDENVNFKDGTNTTVEYSSGVKVNVANASTTARGAVELATNTEASAGTDTSRAVTPNGVAAAINARSSAHTITGDASTTEFDVTYGFTAFAANDVMIQVVESSTGDTVFAEVDRLSTTQCRIKFASAPATSKTYRILCFKIM